VGGIRRKTYFYLTIMKKLSKTIALLQLTSLTVNWIHSIFRLNAILPIERYNILIDHLILVCKTRGPIGIVEYTKLIRTALLLYLSGEYPRKKVIGIGLTKSGLPKVLSSLLGDQCYKFPALLQITNTILFCTRALKLGLTPDTVPIEGPSLSSFPSIGKYRFQFWRDLGYMSLTGHIPGALRFKRYHFTSKSGPSGHALWTSLADLSLVIRDETLIAAVKLVGGPKLSNNIDVLIKVLPILSKVLPVNGRSLRKLSWFPDKEMKVRVVAIGDYWSQCALKPLHHYLFRLLRKIPQDCTFNQAAFTDKVKGWEVFYSIDLTAATDRFPISVIYDVLNGHLPVSYLNAWKHIMVGLPFDFQDRKISYSVGNPMGFYSSWASFAVAHHYVIYYCCKELNIPWKEAKYCILGDDVLLGDTSLKDKYVEVITQLGVNFSPLKTHESTKLFEFAKRLFLNGTEISPFPISSLKESSTRYYLMVNLLDELSKKGWVAPDGIPQAIFLFYKMVMKRNTVYSAKLRDESYFSELIMKVIRGTLAAHEALNTLMRHFGYKVRDLRHDEGIAILSNVAIETFTKSNPTKQKGIGYPLGQLAEDLVLYLTGFIEDEEIGEIAIDCITRVPHLAVYGLIEEAYLAINKEARRYTHIDGGEWPMLLRTMALPLDDRVFVQRQSHLVSRASAIIGKILRHRFKILEIYPDLLSDWE